MFKGISEMRKRTREFKAYERGQDAFKKAQPRPTDPHEAEGFDFECRKAANTAKFSNIIKGMKEVEL